MRPLPLLRRTPSLLLIAVAAAWPVPAQEEGGEPEPERGLRLEEPGALQGYTLIAPLLSRTVYLLDMQGQPVHTWQTDRANGWVYLKDDGHLLWTGREEDNPRFAGGGIAGRLREYDWDGNVLWDYLLADDYQTLHHDIEPLPDGNVLAIVWEHRFQEDCVAWGRDSAVVGEAGLWPDAIIEIHPTPPEGGEIVWEWHAWDHVIQDFDPEAEGYGDVAAHPEKIDINADHRDQPPMSKAEIEAQKALEAQMRALGYVGGEEDDTGSAPQGPPDASPDWLHTNAVDYLPELDLIVLSSPELNEIWIIDHSTTTDEAAWDSGGRWGKGGDLLYRWGNPKNYGAGTEADRRLFYQHNPTFVPGESKDELRLLVFNNGGDGKGEFSAVYELLLPFDPKKGFVREEGKPFGPADPIWTYEDRGNFYSSFISGAQRLPNGNTLICEGAKGRVFEVTRAGKIVWDYLNPYGGEVKTGGGGGESPVSLFRATRIPADHPALAGRDL